MKSGTFRIIPNKRGSNLVKTFNKSRQTGIGKSRRLIFAGV